jgi:hypothetical protein
MYRDGLDGLTERVRGLEEEKSRLERDLACARRIRLPQRAVRATVALVVLVGAGAFGAALGYRHAMHELQEASQADGRFAMLRIARCHEKLAKVLASPVVDEEEGEY